ncbi:hypothetical protein [Gimesia fumaroli]|uniref:Uncharacterized protein n=1 Tax=Gimesia fumaroli TaxID=2527976 RepID=A0A518IED1_9PLAN|nr:hypothetical protein [Gimesia fumaroli]QDV51446.1 hypothetical protein Enr17x_35020 [Gimesia fumaroli]
MSDDNFYSEENDSQPEEFSAQPKQGMSTGVKVLLILLGVGGVVLLLCCGGLFYAFRSTEFKMTEKKEDIIDIQNEITEITIPDSFKPQAGMSMKIVGMEMRMAIYEEAAKQGALILMSIGTPDDGMVDLEKEFQKNMRQNNQNQRELKINKEEEREFMIKGKKVTFNFAEGTDKNGKEFHQISGVFAGKKGPAFLFVQIASDTYNEEEIVKMIESIK